LPPGSSSYAAIDTGTTLVGGPSQYISQIFAQIPGSAPGQGSFQNYYTYRKINPVLHLLRAPKKRFFFIACDATVNVSISFGGKRNWTISPSDFQLTKLSQNQCLGAFFELSTGSSAPTWIVGDTFLVNILSLNAFNLTKSGRKMSTLFSGIHLSQLASPSFLRSHWRRTVQMGLRRPLQLAQLRQQFQPHPSLEQVAEARIMVSKGYVEIWCRWRGRL